MIDRCFWAVVLGVCFVSSCAQPLPLQRATPSVVREARTPSASNVTPTTGGFAVPKGGQAAATITSTGSAIAVIPTLPATPGTNVVVPSTLVAVSPADMWQAQQTERVPFEPARIYRASVPVALLWFDPATGQTLEVGRVIGEFRVVAEFGLKQQASAKAFAVPYRIDQDYGMTSISSAVVARMRAAGYSDAVEAYILAEDSITPVAAAAMWPSFSVLASSSTFSPQ